MKEQENREALIRYRIEQANRTVETAELLILNEKYNAAVNRIYYGMFYMLLAIAAKEGFETSKHLQLMGGSTKHLLMKAGYQKNSGK